MIHLIVLCLGFMVFGFLIGKHHERLGWNGLIKKGIIPKPREVKIPDHLIEK